MNTSSDAPAGVAAPEPRQDDGAGVSYSAGQSRPVAISFVVPVHVLGTSRTESRFESSEGWRIAETPSGVVLERPEDDAQNLPAIAAFRVAGVGYSVTHNDATPVDVLAESDATPVEHLLSEEGKAKLAAGDATPPQGVAAAPVISEAALEAGSRDVSAEAVLGTPGVAYVPAPYHHGGKRRRGR